MKFTMMKITFECGCTYEGDPYGGTCPLHKKPIKKHINMIKINLIKPKWSGFLNHLPLELKITKIYRDIHNYYNQFTQKQLRKFVLGK